MRELFARIAPARTPQIDADALAGRLTALDRAVDLAAPRLPAASVEPARDVVARANERRALAGHLTVVALAGSTGAGKSSIFNAVVGDDVAGTSVLRPTTSEPMAAQWTASPESAALLDWLGVKRRHVIDDGPAALADLVLIDLPDHDSTSAAHRAHVDRIVARADVMVWVLDPQKYADALVHEAYLARYAHHSDVTLILLNQADRLTVAEAAACTDHLRRLVDADGLADAEVITTSVRSGEGLGVLAERLTDAVAGRRAALQRLAADVASAAAQLDSAVGTPRADGAPPAAGVDSLTDALTAAVDADGIAAAVGESRRLRAVAAVGWPPLRWLSRLRPDPVTRLRLDRPGVAPELVRSSLPAADPVVAARARNAVVAYADAASAQLPPPWVESTRAVAATAAESLPDHLDQAVARAPLVDHRTPLWWRAVGALQWLLLGVAVVGGLWLVGLVVLGYLQFSPGPAPRVEGLPVPTVMLITGALGGLVLAAVGRLIAGSSAARAARAARRALRDEVAVVATAQIAEPVQDEVDSYTDFRTALAAAAGRGSGR